MGVSSGIREVAQSLFVAMTLMNAYIYSRLYKEL